MYTLALLFSFLFLTKLFGWLTLSWWWVWAPIYLPLSTALALLGGIFFHAWMEASHARPDRH